MALDGRGLPLSHHVFPGATADPLAFSEALSDLGRRFPVWRVVVADRGCVSRKNLDLLSQMGCAWIVGRRLRRERRIAEEVLSRPGRYARVVDEEGREVENFMVKEVILEGERYIICLNPEEAEHDRLSREAMISELEEKLRESPSSLIGNSGYRRFLKLEGRPRIDYRKVREEERYDGKWVLHTTCDLPDQE